MKSILISETERRILFDLVHRHLPGAKVYAFGSRVKGTASRTSDLDLAVETDQVRRAAELKEAFEESDLPFIVDLHVLPDLPKEFQAEILRTGKPLFPADNVRATRPDA